MGIPSSSDFFVRVRADGDDVELGLVGDFDRCAADRFRSCVERAIEGSRGAVIVDLRDLTFIDSTGIAALLQMRRSLDAAGRELRVVHVSSRAARVFELTGLTAVFPDADFDAART